MHKPNAWPKSSSLMTENDQSNYFTSMFSLNYKWEIVCRRPVTWLLSWLLMKNGMPSGSQWARQRDKSKHLNRFNQWPFITIMFYRFDSVVFVVTPQRRPIWFHRIRFGTRRTTELTENCLTFSRAHLISDQIPSFSLSVNNADNLLEWTHTQSPIYIAHKFA